MWSLGVLLSHTRQYIYFSVPIENVTLYLLYLYEIFSLKEWIKIVSSFIKFFFSQIFRAFLDEVLPQWLCGPRRIFCCFQARNSSFKLKGKTMRVLPPVFLLLPLLSITSSSNSRDKIRLNWRLLPGTTSTTTRSPVGGGTTTVVYSAEEIVKLWASRRATTSRPVLPTTASTTTTTDSSSRREQQLLKERIFGLFISPLSSLKQEVRPSWATNSFHGQLGELLRNISQAAANLFNRTTWNLNLQVLTWPQMAPECRQVSHHGKAALTRCSQIPCE